MNKVEWLLVWLLRVEGLILLLALPFVFVPTAQMEKVHGWMQLGDFPHGPLVEYLTRSLAGLYALWAPLYLYLSLDVRKYAALVGFLAVTKGLFGVGMLFLDLSVGMPLFWTLGEGPAIFVVSVLQYELARRLQLEG